MSFRSKWGGQSCCLPLCLVALLPLYSAELRVCSDPNNMPFSNRAQQGFENRIASVIAVDLHERLTYTWWQQRRNYVKNTLLAGRCDLVIGLPEHMEHVLTTRAYYRSTYVAVTRRNRHAVHSLTDPALAHMRIGLHVVDAGYAPPGYMLASRGLARNLTGYSLFGPAGEVNPPARIVDAVSRGDIDVAIVWGPLGGYFARERGLRVSPISTPHGPVPIAYGISAAVRPGRADLARAVQQALDRNRARIRAILDSYGVPEAPRP